MEIMRSGRKPFVTLCAAAAFTAPLAMGQLARAVNYDLTPLYHGDLNTIYAMGINNSGTVVGYYNVQSRSAGYVSYAFTASTAGGTATVSSVGYIGGNLGPIDPDYPNTDGWAFGINSSGAIAGGGIDPANSFSYSVATGQVGTTGLTSKGSLVGGGTSLTMSFAAAINDRGQMAGAASNGDGIQPIATSASGALVPLSSSFGAAYGINAAGTVVGFTSDTGNQSGPSAARTGKTAVKWTYSSTTDSWSQAPITNPSVALGGSSTSQSVAFGVNNAGQIVGVAETGHGTTAFLEQPDGTVINLKPTVPNGVTTLSAPFGVAWTSLTFGQGTYSLLTSRLGNTSQVGGLGSIAEAINNSGEIVGYVGTGVTTYAALWTVDASGNVTLTNLNSLLPDDTNWVLQEATGINDLGQIVGYGKFNGEEGSWVLTPDGAISVPEPSSLALAGPGAIVALRRRRR